MFQFIYHVGYPNENAVHVALKSVRNWLDKLAAQNKVCVTFVSHTYKVAYTC